MGPRKRTRRRSETCRPWRVYTEEGMPLLVFVIGGGRGESLNRRNFYALQSVLGHTRDNNMRTSTMVLVWRFSLPGWCIFTL